MSDPEYSPQIEANRKLLDRLLPVAVGHLNLPKALMESPPIGGLHQRVILAQSEKKLVEQAVQGLLAARDSTQRISPWIYFDPWRFDKITEE